MTKQACSNGAEDAEGGGHRGEDDGEGSEGRAREGCAKRSREDALTPPAKRSKSPLPSSSVTLSTFPSWHLVSQQTQETLEEALAFLDDDDCIQYTRQAKEPDHQLALGALGGGARSSKHGDENGVARPSKNGDENVEQRPVLWPFHQVPLPQPPSPRRQTSVMQLHHQHPRLESPFSRLSSTGSRQEQLPVLSRLSSGARQEQVPPFSRCCSSGSRQEQVPSFSRQSSSGSRQEQVPSFSRQSSSGSRQEQVASFSRQSSSGSRQEQVRMPNKRTQLDAASVVRIFLAKHTRCKGRDTLSNSFANEYAMTPKAVRDIWNMRTWQKVTKPYWSAADHQKMLYKKLCTKCRIAGVSSMEDACEPCKTKSANNSTADAQAGDGDADNGMQDSSSDDFDFAAQDSTSEKTEMGQASGEAFAGGWKA